MRAPGLGLAFPRAVEPRLIEGWHAPAYGAKLEAPVVSVVAEDVAEHEFQTLIAPSDRRRGPPPGVPRTRRARRRGDG